MENASKALIIAATVLLGIMIASVVALLFSIFSDYVIQLENKKEEYRLMEFNEKIYKYYNENSTIKLTAHDVISLANFAKENNEKYELTNETRASSSTNYLQIVVFAKNSYYNFEKENNEVYSNFLKLYSYTKDEKGDVNKATVYFKCSKIDYNSIGKINYVKIEKT